MKSREDTTIRPNDDDATRKAKHIAFDRKYCQHYDPAGTIPAEDLPMPKWAEETTPIANWQGLVSSLEFALHAAARNDLQRNFLNGVATREGYIASSDGHRGAIDREKSSLFDGMIIPTGAVPLICQLPGGKSFARTENALVVEFETGRFSIQLVDAGFPDLARIVPAAHDGQHVKAERKALERAVTAVARTKLSVHLRFSVENGLVKLEAGTADGGTVVEIQASEAANGWAVDLNAGYLSQALGALDGEQVTISQGGDGRPMLLTGAKESRAAVIMPWRA